jgi:hypothetical protein
VLVFHPLDIVGVTHELHMRIAWISPQAFLFMLDCPIGVAISRLAACVCGDK